MEHRELREQVALAARRMADSGLVTGTSGNISARVPGGGLLVTPSGLEYESTGAEDMVLVDLDGCVIEGRWEPSAETPMHAGICRARPEVGSVVHTHSRFATTLACLGWEIPPVHYMLAALSEEGRVPLSTYATYGTEELAENASAALGRSHRACLLQNHGTITVGSSVAQAFSRTEVLEEMAELYYRSRLAGEPGILSTEHMRQVAEKMVSYGPTETGTA